MKQQKRFALTLAALALLAAALFCPAVSAANLDEIEKYFITVRLQPDGSADIDYDIHWKVLDSTSAGPLEWVKVGVPNDSIQPVSHSDTISDLYYWSEGGSYVRLVLDGKDQEVYYFGLSEISVEVGQSLKVGDTLGKGEATLHLAVYEAGRPTDPLAFFGLEKAKV